MLEEHGAVSGQLTPATASGSSFTAAMKVLATVVVVVAAGWFLKLSKDPDITVPPTISGLFLTAMLVMSVGWWEILNGRTSIGDRAICQTGLWTKEVAIGRISSCRLIHSPGLAWLIAPRLIVRSGFGVVTFYTSHPDVIQAFERLVRSGGDWEAAQSERLDPANGRRSTRTRR